MTAKTRIVAIEASSEGAEALTETASVGFDAAEDTAYEQDWEADVPADRPAKLGWVVPVLALAAILGWSAFYLWANPEILVGTTPQQGIALITNWAVPVLLIGVFWLIVLRSSSREAGRFGDAARLLSLESARLESRLLTVNRELSLARSFLTAQSRDLESLGRTASKKLSQHAEHLQSLVQSNGDQIDAIASVSVTALDNMEKLRDHLPVIANSAKDVTSNIGNAGRMAHAQLVDMVEGFKRLNEFGHASENHVENLKVQVDSTVEYLAARLDDLRDKTEVRFADLHSRTGEFRIQLESNEDNAIAVLRSRYAALIEELCTTRRNLDSHEADSISALRARLELLRDDGAAVSRQLRDGEVDALAALALSRDRLEGTVRETVEKLEALDQQAIEAARNRIATLAQEAESFDARLAERNAAFAEETGQRTQAAAEAQATHVAQIKMLLADIDQHLLERTASHEGLVSRIATHGNTFAARLSEAEQRMQAVANQAIQTDAALAVSLGTLNGNLAGSHQSLREAAQGLEHLTDSSVRLLELLQASSTQAREQIPVALGTGMAQLEGYEARVSRLRTDIAVAASYSADFAQNITGSRGTISQSLDEMNALQANLELGAARYGNLLSTLKTALELLDQDSIRITDFTRNELVTILERLTSAARSAVLAIEDAGAQAVMTLTDKLGKESASTVKRVLNESTDEAVVVLEQAARRAAGLSRDSAKQLHDQLAQVAQLTTNLEHRISNAREKAEEQVDGAFSRRAALITESLNSNAIDIAKALSTEVSDSAWASYLRGDRGIFTRRTVRLLEKSEARSIAQVYGEDPEFRDHVSHYIHDFEAMLRQILSTRDGHALGVTLLSSDMGKLYVALAQAIERLRK
ncbi:MAG: hypothetical protein RLZZ136_564 [Pseudomonadota bacterium]|jgi:hypothetical protein